METSTTHGHASNSFVDLEVQGSTAIVWIDNKNDKMNIVSPNAIDIMESTFSYILDDSAIKSVVIMSRKPDFIAGADIKSFAIEKKGDFRPFQAKGHEIFDRIEKSKKPFVAAVNGACVGLGTELMLACHACVATDSAKTFFGLPEVKLGILPGGGGTQRLPRRVGIQKALDMMLTGKNIYVHKAKKMGLTDQIVDTDKLKDSAVSLAKRLETQPLKRNRDVPFSDRLLEGTSIGRSILFKQAKKMALKQSQGNYPAIPAIIDCVETGYKKGIAKGYERELDLFEELILTKESAALRYLFFSMTDNKKNPTDVEPKTINTLAVIGGGFMGAGIAQISIDKDVDVILQDINADTLEKARDNMWASLLKKVRNRALTEEEAKSKINHLRNTLSYESFEKVDLVIEAVVEIMKVKKSIIDDVQKHGKEDVIFSSNTSSLSVTEMAEYAKFPEHVIGMHYFSPVPKMPLLEIVKTKYTSQQTISTCYEFGVKQGKTVIVVQDGPGFYVNRILAPYLNEALLMADEGGNIEEIDRAMKKLGFPVGPFTLLDQVGLDVAKHVTGVTEPLFSPRPGVIINRVPIKLAEDGKLGRKSGEGFYSYDPKTKKRQNLSSNIYSYFDGNGQKSIDQNTIQTRGLYMLLNEAIMCLEEGIISNVNDGNIGAVFGIGFLPFTGGPFKYMDQVGIDKVLSTMEELKSSYGERFEPRPLLKQMAANKETFMK